MTASDKLCCFQWRVPVRPCISDARGNGTATVMVALRPGQWVVSLTGVYGSGGEGGGVPVAPGSEAIDFKQASHCGVTAFSPLTLGQLEQCVYAAEVGRCRLNSAA